MLNGLGQALLERQGQAELGLHKMASSYTPIYPITCHFYLSLASPTFSPANLNLEEQKYSLLLLPLEPAGRDPGDWRGKNSYLLPALVRGPGSLSRSSPGTSSVQPVKFHPADYAKTVGEEDISSPQMGVRLAGERIKFTWDRIAREN